MKKSLKKNQIVITGLVVMVAFAGYFGMRNGTELPVATSSEEVNAVTDISDEDLVLLHALEDKRIYVSSGSACSSNHPGISGTLVAIGVPKELLDSTLRFSFSEFTTKEQLDYTLEQLEKLLPVLRKFTRR